MVAQTDLCILCSVKVAQLVHTLTLSLSLSLSLNHIDRSIERLRCKESSLDVSFSVLYRIHNQAERRDPRIWCNLEEETQNTHSHVAVINTNNPFNMFKRNRIFNFYHLSSDRASLFVFKGCWVVFFIRLFKFSR